MSRSWIFIIILIVLIPSFTQVYAANPVQLVVRVTLSDGTPIAGVLINVTSNGEVIASDVTDDSGQAIFNLPGNQTYTVVASYGVWSDSKKVLLGNETEIITFIVKYGLPIETYQLPLRLTIWTPGGFILTFEEADNVTATVVKYQPGAKYNLIVRKNYINFECNSSGYFIIDIYVEYRRLDWHTGSLVTYSTSALLRTIQGFNFYSRKLVVNALVEAIIGPHYPTPSEIAKAQAKYLKEVEDKILQAILKSNTETYLQFKQFNRILNETNDNLKKFGEYYKKNVDILTSNLSRLFTNTWFAVIILAIVIVFIGVVMLSIYHSRG